MRGEDDRKKFIDYDLDLIHHYHHHESTNEQDNLDQVSFVLILILSENCIRIHKYNKQ